MMSHDISISEAVTVWRAAQALKAGEAVVPETEVRHCHRCISRLYMQHLKQELHCCHKLLLRALTLDLRSASMLN